MTKQESIAEETGSAERSTIAVPGNHSVKVVAAVTVRREVADLYRFWRDPERIQEVVSQPVSITRKSDTESDWTVTGPPGDREVSWTSVIINDEPDRLIAWESRPGADVGNAGTVRFKAAPGDEGVEVILSVEYNLPGGRVTEFLSKLFPENPGRQIREALRRFKALMEAGEFPTIDGQSRGGSQATKKGKK